jgi:type IV secretory pathway VirB10-like protein
MIGLFGVELQEYLNYKWSDPMFIPYLRQVCLFFFFSSVALSSSADVYKWVDENGQTHYSEKAPADQKAEMIKAPPPPATLPEDAQQKIDALITQQSEAKKAQQEQITKQKQDAEQKQILEDNCNLAKTNLQTYLDNPGRRVLKEDGTVVRPTEEDRQQKIQEAKQDINEFCK